MIRLLTFAAAVTALSITGCSGGGMGTVEGQVLIDGEPQGGYEVNFTSTADGSGAMGSAMQEGRYKLFRGRGETEIPIGEYKVTVAPSPFIDGIPMPKVKLDETYTDLDKTVLIKQVEPGKNVIDLEVETK